MIYAELTAVAAVTVYIVGVSGFTQSWRNAVARALHVSETRLRPLKPFDCPACMTWWACLIYAAVTARLSVWTVLASAALSLLSIPLEDWMLLLREAISAAARKLFDKL